MDGSDSDLQVGVADDHRNPNLRGRNDLHIDPGVRECAEEAGRHPRVRLHPGTDQRDLADVIVIQGPFEADLTTDLLQRGQRGAAVGLRKGEGDVGPPGAGHRPDLHDHVEVDVRVGDGPEDGGGHAGLVRAAGHGHLRLALVVSDPTNDGLFHELCLRNLGDPRTRLRGERGPDVYGDGVAACVLDTAKHQHLGSAGRHLHHFLVGNALDAAGVRHDPRVGGENAVHIGVDLAEVGLQCGCEGHSGCIRAAPTERCHVLRILADALETGDDRNRSRVQSVADAPRRDIDDAGLAVRRSRDHAGLGARERACLGAQVRDRHGQQRH